MKPKEYELYLEEWRKTRPAHFLWYFGTYLPSVGWVVPASSASSA